MPKFELRDETGAVAAATDDRSSLRKIPLSPGAYTLWKHVGTVVVKEVPATQRVAIASTTSKKRATPTGDASASATEASPQPRSGVLGRFRG
jgi:hypothetical protein